jgi:hypothetical protein
VLAGLAVLTSLPAMAADEPRPVVILDEDAADACLNFTPVEEPKSDLELALLAVFPDAVTTAAKRKPCKACPDQPWCACTYNGYPRVSCDPCCYVNNFGLQICTS